MASFTGVGGSPPDFPVIPRTWVRTASRTQSPSTSPVSSMITASSGLTASRTTSRRSPARTAGDACSSGARSRRRSRSAFSSAAFSRRQSAHERRCRSRWHAGSLHTRWRAPARGCGWNHRRQIRQGRVRGIARKRLCDRDRPPSNRRGPPGAMDFAQLRLLLGGSFLTSRGGSFLASGEVLGWSNRLIA